MPTYLTLVGILVSAALGFADTSRAAAPPPFAPTHPHERRLTLPLSFEENAGQTDPAIRFVARGDGYLVGLTDAGPRLLVRAGADARAAIELRFADAAVPPTVEGLDPLPGVSHYYLGADRSRWVERARHFERVGYRGVYPGVDVVFYARGRTLEYDLQLQPGADPGVIGFAIAGAEHIAVDADGNVVLEIGGRAIVLERPTTYQVVGAERRPIASRYRLADDRIVRVEVAAYDRSVPLVIDPVLSYATYLGGTLGDRVGDLAVDAGGNAYVTGFTFSLDFPASPGAVRAAGSDIFVARLNAAGSALIFSTFLGGSGNENDGRIAVDGAANVYVSGVTASSNFPVLNAAQPGNAGSLDFTLTKLSAAGTMVYSTYLGGSSIELFADGLAIDDAGAAYLCGQTISTNFPVTPAAWDERCGNTGTCDGGFDGVVAKIGPDGDTIEYATYVGGGKQDFTIDVDVDAAGAAYVIGMTNSTDLPTTAGAAQPVYAGDSGAPLDGGDAFLVKLTPSGDAAAYATYLGGSDDDGAFGVAVDRTGSAYLVGATTSTDFPVTPGALQETFAGGVGGGGQFVGGDGFVAKLTPAGDAVVYATYVGGSENDKMNRVALHGSSAYVAGETRSADLPVLAAFQPTFGGGDFDGYVFRLSADGATLLGASYLGGSDDVQATGLEFAAGLAVDRDGDLYVSGGTSASDFPTTAGAFAESYGGAGSGLGDGWVAKLPMGSNPRGAAADHYLCYKARGGPKLSAVPGLALASPFESVAVDVRKRSLFCTPADRAHQGSVFPDVHLQDYAIKRVKGAPKAVPQLGLTVVNQLGSFQFDARQEVGLLAPTSLAAAGPVATPDPAHHGVDHHACYKVKTAKGATRFPKGVQVALGDGFEPATTYVIDKPSRLCLAAGVAGGEVERTTGHLMCYRVKRASGAHARQAGLHLGNEIEAANPAGPAVVETIKERELCVPSIVDPGTAPVCGDGVLNQASEQCDAPDQLACPGILCGADCRCAPAGICGNGLAEPPGEQCDGLDDDACPGTCSTLCTCPGPRTFTIDGAISQAQTSLGITVPLAGAVDFVVGAEVLPGVMAFDIPITQLPGVNLGGLVGTICPFLAQDPALPPGIAGRGVLNCAGVDVTGTGFLVSTELTRFQDHCVQGAGCDSAPNPGGGKVHAVSGVFVPDGTVDPTCTLPGDVPDTNPLHPAVCNGPSRLGVGTDAYLPGDATLTLTVILDQRATGDPCNPPASPAASPVKIDFTTGHKQGGIMDLQGSAGGVFAFDFTGAPFDCERFLLESDAAGAAIVGVFPAIDAPLIGLRLDLLSAIRMEGTTGP